MLFLSMNAFVDVLSREGRSSYYPLAQQKYQPFKARRRRIKYNSEMESEKKVRRHNKALLKKAIKGRRGRNTFNRFYKPWWSYL
jgi:hypothetical protein